MNSRFRSLLASLLLLALLLPGKMTAQDRGKALYDLMTSERLVTTEGTPQVNWMPNGQGYFERQGGDEEMPFVHIDPETGARTPLFDDDTASALRESYASLSGKDADGFPFGRFTYVMDGSGLTFEADRQTYLFTFQDHALRALKQPTLEPRPAPTDVIGTTHMRASQIWTGTFSPDFSSVAYVKDYDLYLMDTTTGEEQRLTEGGTSTLMNGRADWVYPEELSQGDAFFWSPDGHKLAYLQFDEREVFHYPLVHSLAPKADLEQQAYPKPGETNPTVRLFIIDLETGRQIQVKTDSSSDVYILKPTWLLDSSALTFQRLNRHQNHLQLMAADATTGTTRQILEETEAAFVLLHDDFILLNDGRHFLWSSERTGWRHLYLYDLAGTVVRQLTTGEWPVGGITAVDQANGRVFFTGYTEMGLETHFFRVNLDGTGFRKLTEEPGSHRISMDPAAQYYTDFYSSFTAPPTASLYAADGSKLRTLLTTNTERLDALRLEPPELVIVKADDGVTDLHGLLYKPAGYNPDMSYPLLVPVYGGPYSKAVSNSYQMTGRDQQLAQLGFMVFRVDNRGQTRRGKAFETATYLKLGQVDLADQAAGIRQITRRPYIDGGRVGVYGGSYGGYMTAMALLKEPDVFHVGVAGAPVTDWRNYDTAYTERYMRTPQENKEGYDLGSTLPYAGNLKGKLLLVHGTIDNNVHPGNSTQLINALVEAGMDFDMMFYPEHRHGIRGAAGVHYRNLQLNYLLEHLDPPPYPWTR